MSTILKWAGNKSGLAAEESKRAPEIIAVCHLQHMGSL